MKRWNEMAPSVAVMLAKVLPVTRITDEPVAPKAFSITRPRCCVPLAVNEPSIFSKVLLVTGGVGDAVERQALAIEGVAGDRDAVHAGDVEVAALAGRGILDGDRGGLAAVRAHVPLRTKASRGAGRGTVEAHAVEQHAGAAHAVEQRVGEGGRIREIVVVAVHRHVGERETGAVAVGVVQRHRAVHLTVAD